MSTSFSCYNCGGRGHKKIECPTYKVPQGPGRGRSRVRSHNSNRTGTGNHIILDNSGRTKDRKFFDRITKNRDYDIESASDALRFLQAACKFANLEGNEELLYRFAGDVGCLSLKKALQYVNQHQESPDIVLIEGFIPVIELLASPTLQKPALRKPLRQLLCNIYSFRLNITELIHHYCIFHQEHIDQNQATLFSWFFSQVAVSNDDAGANARAEPLIHELCNVLSIFHCTNDLETILGVSKDATKSLPSSEDHFEGNQG